MDRRIMLLRALTQKMGDLQHLRNSVTGKLSWVSSVRQALGMTASQLASRLGVSSPRITKMESNELNLKISTMEKIAQSMDCDFVYGFVPKDSLQATIDRQARKKAAQILTKVNANMALEDQLAKDPHILDDLANEMITKNIKRIWDE